MPKVPAQGRGSAFKILEDEIHMRERKYEEMIDSKF